MKLYLLRHGDAFDVGEEGIRMDKDRTLTPTGELQARRVAAMLKKCRAGIDTVLASPFLRARQTAEIVAAALPGSPAVTDWPALLPGSDPERVTAALAGRPARENPLLVGHMPLLGDLVSFLVWGRAAPEIAFKKSGLACLTVLTLNPSPSARLEWLLTPTHY